MKNNIALFNISKDISKLIDKNKFSIKEYTSFEQLQNNLKKISLVIFDLEQKQNFKILFEQIKKENNTIIIVGLINFSRMRIATKLLKNNLNDYILKDIKEQIDSINDIIEKTLNGSEKQAITLKEVSMLDFISVSTKLKKTVSDIKTIANANIPILIRGEQGCELETYAKAIHDMSNRKNNLFLSLFCPSINRDNIEKILYGDKDIIGKMEMAKNGTIFFENIDLLDKNMQNIFVKIFENGEVDGINGTKQTFNIRIIASTTKDLEEEVRNGRFNEELFFMINSYTINIPPLRENREVIPFLVKNLYKSYSIEQNKIVSGITNKALKILETYNWPGNVKEIKNTICKAVLLNKSGILNENDFLNLKIKNIVEKNETRELPDGIYTVNLLDKYGKLKDINTIENEVIDKYMKIHDGSITETSKSLGYGRATLYRKIERNQKERKERKKK